MHIEAIKSYLIEEKNKKIKNKFIYVIHLE
jgi:hypothetical protein